MLKLKLANEVRIASRTIIHNFSRYLALVLLTLFSFAIALSSLAIMNGMLYSMREKARVYYGGDLQFIGGNGSLNIYNSEELTSRLEKILASHISIRSRIDYGADYDKILFFEGNSVPIRIIKGLDFAVNHDLFQYFNFLSGSFYEVEKDNGILISSAIAEKLQVKVGDSLTLYLDNFQRKIDTTQVVIKGIFLDTSLFGMYSVYMDLENLRNTINAPKDYINRIGLYFPKGKEPSRFEIENIQKLLENEFGIEHIHPLSNDKDDFYAAMYKTKSRPYYALIPLDANLKDLRQIIEAMKIIIYGLSALLIIIVMIGISSTYRVIIAKRVREIGIYVSQGFSNRRISRIFLSEVIFIIITGFLAGILSAFAISYFVSSLDFSSIPAFDLFLSNGSLLSRYSFIHTLVIFSSVFVTTLVSVLFTIRKAIQIDPAKALSNPE
jgi:ABC-type lipoprotein release transport system permease subunit